MITATSLYASESTHDFVLSGKKSIPTGSFQIISFKVPKGLKQISKQQEGPFEYISANAKSRQDSLDFIRIEYIDGKHNPENLEDKLLTARVKDKKINVQFEFARKQEYDKNGIAMAEAAVSYKSKNHNEILYFAHVCGKAGCMAVEYIKTVDTPAQKEQAKRDFELLVETNIELMVFTH
jgi:hypothetical protein